MASSTVLDLQSLPTSRGLAKELGSRHYFTGKPCSKGHVCARFTSTMRCTECNKLQVNDYRNSNPEKAKETNRKSAAKRRATDPVRARRESAIAQSKYQKTPLGKVKNALKSRLHDAFRRAKKVKNKNTLTFLGCSYADLISHLERQFQPGMSWENQGEWHIDHIRPIASFEQPDDPECWHYTNLQPLWALDNIKKGARWAA